MIPSLTSLSNTAVGSTPRATVSARLPLSDKEELSLLLKDCLSLNSNASARAVSPLRTRAATSPLQGSGDIGGKPFGRQDTPKDTLTAGSTLTSPIAKTKRPPSKATHGSGDPVETESDDAMDTVAPAQTAVSSSDSTKDDDAMDTAEQGDGATDTNRPQDQQVEVPQSQVVTNKNEETVINARQWVLTPFELVSYALDQFLGKTPSSGGQKTAVETIIAGGHNAETPGKEEAFKSELDVAITAYEAAIANVKKATAKQNSWWSTGFDEIFKPGAWRDTFNSDAAFKRAQDTRWAQQVPSAPKGKSTSKASTASNVPQAPPIVTALIDDFKKNRSLVENMMVLERYLAVSDPQLKILTSLSEEWADNRSFADQAANHKQTMLTGIVNDVLDQWIKRIQTSPMQGNAEAIQLIQSARKESNQTLSQIVTTQGLEKWAALAPLLDTNYDAFKNGRKGVGKGKSLRLMEDMSSDDIESLATDMCTFLQNNGHVGASDILQFFSDVHVKEYFNKLGESGRFTYWREEANKFKTLKKQLHSANTLGKNVAPSTMNALRSNLVLVLQTLPTAVSLYPTHREGGVAVGFPPHILHSMRAVADQLLAAIAATTAAMATAVPTEPVLEEIDDLAPS